MTLRPGLFGIMLVLAIGVARAADVSGNWRVTISTAGERITGVGSLKQAGDSVTGWVGPSEDDPIPITGVLKGNKLKIQTVPQPGRTVAFNKCEVTVAAEKMSGTIDGDKGTIEFVRTAAARDK